MPFSTITAILSNSTVVSTTITTADFVDGAAAIQAIIKSGFFADSTGQNFYPISAISKFTVS